MDNETLEQLKYPIGKYERPQVVTQEILTKWIDDIETFPARLNEAVKQLTEQQIDMPYRPDGWTKKQVIHHCADSHINSYVRFKLAITEDRPTVKPYFEERWAELEDAKTYPIDSSLRILEGLHARWALLLRNLTDEQLARTFIHPEHTKDFRLDEYIGFYAWHCNHHLGHILIRS